MCSVEQKPVFRDLTGEDPDPEVTEIESLCMNCHSSGMTRLLLTRIPYYKNVVIMSFSCEECGYENNEIQPGGAFAELGVRWKLHVDTQTDLNRQVVKSDYTSVRIPELDFEIPAQSQKGEVTTVEGIISRAVSGLTQDQSARREQHPEAAEQIDRFVARLQELRHLEKKWTLELEDISGNCFVENPEAPRKDPRCERSDFARSPEQNHALGIFTREEVSKEPEPKLPVATDSLLTPADPANCTYDAMAADEVLQFRTNCPECNAPADTNMKLTPYRFVNIFNDSLCFVEYICQCCHCVYEVLEGDRLVEVETNCPLCDTTIDPDIRPPKIPHFKEVVIMATICDACGHRTNEVKSGGGVEDKGVRFEVRVANKDDFSRDILKSETCSMERPELQLVVGGRALGGRFTTAEGLLRATVEQLADAPGVVGDAPSLAADSLDTFVAKLNEVLEGKRSVTIVLDDPAGNSYVQSLNDEDPSMPDDGLKITRYERSFEQNEELGLNDLKTEGYEAT